MRILGGLFGKDELERLRSNLARQTAQVEQLLEDLRATREDVANQQVTVKALREANEGLLLQVVTLQAEANECSALRTEVDRLETDLLKAWEQQAQEKAEAQRLSAELSQSQQRHATLITELRNCTEASNELKAENHRLSLDNQDLRSALANRERLFVDRESKVQEKSQKLIQQQANLSSRESELNAREQYWKNTVEPGLREYEARCSLDELEKELLIRENAVAAKMEAIDGKERELERLGITATELLTREKSIDVREARVNHQETAQDKEKVALSAASKALLQREDTLKHSEKTLAKFKKRVERLDTEAATLSKREDRLDKRELRYQADLKAKRKEFKDERAELEKREEDLRKRETDLNHGEQKVGRLRDQLEAERGKNAKLQNELAETCTRLEECLGSRDQVGNMPASAIGSEKNRKPNQSDDQPLPPIDKPPLALRSNSPLTGAGYHVGNSGIDDEEERRSLLALFISTPLSRLPKVGNSEYMRLWGDANTKIRIRYVAFHIFWNIEFQGAKGTMDLAREHWLKDLRWLKRTFGSKLAANHWPAIPKM